MKASNEQMNPEQLGGILRNFAQENQKMDMMDEMSKYQ